MIEMGDLLKLPTVKDKSRDAFCMMMQKNMDEFLPIIEKSKHLYTHTWNNSDKHYDIFFVPKDLMTAKFLTFQERRNIRYMKSIASTHSEFAESICDKIEDNLEDIKEEDCTKDQIAFMECYMIICTNKQYHIHTCIPAYVIEFIYQGAEYTCENCGFKHISDVRSIDSCIPDIRYTQDKKSGKIFYYCKHCVPDRGWMILGDGKVQN